MLNTLHGDLVRLEPHDERCDRRRRELDHEKTKLEQRLAGLQQYDQRDALAVYGHKMRRLLLLLHEHRHEFSAAPLGPLGLFIKLPDAAKDFAVAVEVALSKSLLQSFLVVNSRDKALLDSLRHRAQCHPYEANGIVATRTGRRYTDVPKGPLAHHRISNVITVAHDDVFNALVDVANTENNLLCNIANETASRGSLLRRDVASEVQALQDALERIEHERTLLRQEQERAQHVRDDARRYETHLATLTRRIHERRVAVRCLERELADDTEENTLDTTVLDSAVEEATSESAEIDARAVTVQALLNNEQTEVARVGKDVNDCADAEAARSTALGTLQGEVNASFQRLRDAKANQMRSALQANAAREPSAKRRARAQGNARIDVTETHAAYTKRLAVVMRKLEAERSRLDGMDLAALLKDMEKTAKYETKQRLYSMAAANAETVAAMLKERMQMYVVLRNEIAVRTAFAFTKIVELNGFAGTLKFDKDNAKLKIVLLKQSASRSSAAKITDMAELSGGERSFTQVALLLALSDRIECPFRVIDEFDVFMDAMTRDMTIQLLVNGAKERATKQFIFVTPNDLAILRRDPAIKIHQMYPPRDRA